MISKIRKRTASIARGEEGFTLIELMIVIAVLGILAGIAIPKFTGVQDKAKKAVAQSLASNIRNAMEMHYAENSNYPNLKDAASINDLNDELTSVTLSESDEINSISFADNSSNTDQYLIELQYTSNGDSIYVGEKGIAETNDSNEASALSIGG